MPKQESEMAKMVGDMMKGAVVDAMESVMDSGAMQVFLPHLPPTHHHHHHDTRGSS